MALLDTFLQKNIIKSDEIDAVRNEIKLSGGNLEKVLIDRKVNPKDILEIKGEYFGLPVRDLEGKNVPFDILRYVPQESAEHYKFVPISLTDGMLDVGVVDPDNIEARDALNFISSKMNIPYRIFLISEADFVKVIKTYKGLSGEVTKALTELETELAADIDQKVNKDKTKDDLKNAGEKVGHESETRIIEDAPVTKIVATILNYATQGDASDVHIEMMSDKVRVRFRVDGVLNTSLILPVKVHSAIIARIKILSSMRLDEKRKPQDGRFSANIEGRKIDFRVSTFPSYYGEKIVMRILDRERGVKKLNEIGLSKRNYDLIKEAIKRPYGMILISGPTGSGKSTTLYSMLNEIDRETQNVVSLEDPVEYSIPGMSQSQVHPEIDYTFANGLRSTLRQDPDIIMVGEIRDTETAKLAIQAALTGHLVLSTIHTNNTVGVIPRLVAMGVDPFLIAPTLILAVAQRLVKTLCADGGKEVPLDGAKAALVESAFTDLPEKYKKDIKIGNKVYQAEKTSKCPKGTSGREAVMEVLYMDKELEDLILHDPSEINIMKIARKQGMLTMKEDAILKAFNRQIPFEEINRL